MPDPEAFATITVSGGVARAVVRGAHARRLCEGHFPGDPIVPGAQLAGLMAEVAAAVAGEGRVLRRIERCVFLAPVRPGGEIVVSARSEQPGRVAADVHAGGVCAARATLRFADAG